MKHFCWGYGKILWMGYKDTREVKPASIERAFVRKYANTSISYQSQGDGSFEQVKSDRDEKRLADFDGRVHKAAGKLIDFSRQWRDTGPIAPRLSPAEMEVCKQIIVAQARRTRESQDRAGLGDDNLFLAYEAVDLVSSHTAPLGAWYWGLLLSTPASPRREEMLMMEPTAGSHGQQSPLSSQQPSL